MKSRIIVFTICLLLIFPIMTIGVIAGPEPDIQVGASGASIATGIRKVGEVI
jgi:hypothetical protein